MIVWVGRFAMILSAETGTVFLLLKIGRMDPEWSMKLSRKGEICFAALCLILAADLSRKAVWQNLALCLFGILTGCLATACVMDLYENLIYRYVWWIGGAAAAILFFSEAGSAECIRERGVPILVFVLIQYIIFGKMYGRADRSAFSVCAVALAALGQEFADFVLVMALAFGGLAVVQGIRKNIGRDGNLKTPVPLVPYIVAAFWFWVDFMA